MSITPSRRQLVAGAAWSVPAVVVASSVPALAASGPCDPQPAVWNLKSRIVRTDEDYSNVNFEQIVTFESTPPGEASLQHWTNPQNTTLFWRLPLGFPEGLKSGARIVIPFDPSWTNPSTPSPYSLALFKRFGAANPDAFTEELPPAAVTVNSDNITIVFSGEVAAGAAGGFQFTTQPVGGAEAVAAGKEFTAQAVISFTPVNCL